MNSIRDLMQKLAQLMMAQKGPGDIQLPNESGLVDPRLAESLPPGLAGDPAGAILEKRRARMALGMGAGQ